MKTLRLLLCTLLLSMTAIAAGGPSAVAAPKAIGIAAGNGFACALMASHAIECWGNGTDGDLGNGAASQSSTPVLVSGISHAAQIAAGGYNACAVLSTGRIKCWGDDTYGQLGNGAHGTTSDVPVYVAGILHAARVDVGTTHACALTTTGAVKCWGDGTSGALGDGSVAEHDTPVQVTGILHKATWVSAGQSYSCAVQASRAKCWGHNAEGELGIGRINDRHVPVVVQNLGTAVLVINAGIVHTCALIVGPTGHAARCWGFNNYGQVGNGSTHEVHLPAHVSGWTSLATSIAPGLGFTCGVRGGAAKCWGLDASGQLGTGGTPDRHTPAQVANLTSGVVKVATGSDAGYALLASGGVRSWGVNSSGQLGDGDTTPSPVPVTVHLS